MSSVKSEIIYLVRYSLEKWSLWDMNNFGTVSPGGAGSLTLISPTTTHLRCKWVMAWSVAWSRTYCRSSQFGFVSSPRLSFLITGRRWRSRRMFRGPVLLLVSLPHCPCVSGARSLDTTFRTYRDVLRDSQLHSSLCQLLPIILMQLYRPTATHWLYSHFCPTFYCQISHTKPPTDTHVHRKSGLIVFTPLSAISVRSPKAPAWTPLGSW